MDTNLWDNLVLGMTMYGLASSKESLERQTVVNGDRFAVRPNFIAEVNSSGKWVYTKAQNGQVFYVEEAGNVNGEWVLVLRDNTWEWAQVSSPSFELILELIKSVKLAKKIWRPQEGVLNDYVDGYDAGMDKALEVMEATVKIMTASPPEIGG